MYCWRECRFTGRIWPLPYWMSIELMTIFWWCFVARWCFVIGTYFVWSWWFWGCSIISSLITSTTMPICSSVCNTGTLTWTLPTGCRFHTLWEVIMRIVLIEASLKFLKFLPLRLNTTQESSTWAWWPMRCLFSFFFFFIYFLWLLR